MARRRVPVALTVAGSDPSGAAGIQADLKTFCAFGVHGEAVLAALTVQNTVRVSAIRPVPPSFVAAQIEALLEDVPPHAIKTGMLPTAAIVRAVARTLGRVKAPLIVDPVMVSSTGRRLLDRAAVRAMREHLFPLATLVTPNLPEVAVLTGIRVTDDDDDSAVEAGRRLLGMGAGAALVKGGHGRGPQSRDVFVSAEGIRVYSHPRLQRLRVRGTGCTLSAGIAACLSRGLPLEKAIEQAQTFVHFAIRDAWRLGKGRGPVNHFARWSE